MKFLALIALLIASFPTGVRPDVQDAELRVGVGAVVITPPTGTPLSGYVVSARCAEESGELMVAAAIRLLNELASKGETK